VKGEGKKAQELGTCARELSEAADSAHPVKSSGARQAPWSCSEESPGSKTEGRGDTKSAPFLKRPSLGGVVGGALVRSRSDETIGFWGP
jgi:hypothetical protein